MSLLLVDEDPVPAIVQGLSESEHLSDHDLMEVSFASLVLLERTYRPLAAGGHELGV